MSKYTQYSILLVLTVCLFMPSFATAQVFVYRGMIEDPDPIADRAYKEVQVADLNEDGCPDLYLAQKQILPSNNIPVEGPNIDRVLINTCSQGSLSDPLSVLQFQDQPDEFYKIKTVRGYDAEMADLDGDGHLDVVRPDDLNRIHILWGDGSGRFSEIDRVINEKNDPNPLGRYDSVALSDLDNDGDLDIVAAQYNGMASNGTENIILRNRLSQGASRSFTIESGQLPAVSTHTVSSDYFSGRSLPDVLVADQFHPKLYHNTSGLGGPLTFTFAAELDVPDVGEFWPTTAAEFFDLNQDGDLDIYIGKFIPNVPANQSQHSVYFGDGLGGMSPVLMPLVQTGAESPIYDVRFADTDLDGNVEILTVNSIRASLPDEVATLQAFSVKRNTQTASNDSTRFFGEEEWYGELAIELADLDLDGDLDLITGGTNVSDTTPGSVSLGHSAIHIYENTTISNVPVEFVATYVTRLGQPRTSFVSTSDNPARFDYSYDPLLGNFEDRPGGTCANGSNNPTYLKVSLSDATLNEGVLDDCTFIASWDGNVQPIQCSDEIIKQLNQGEEFIINTDSYLTDVGLCDEKHPLDAHVRFNETHWLRATFTIDNVDYVRRLIFRKRTHSLFVNANADTYVSQGQPNSNFGGINYVEVRSTSIGNGAFGFWRFAVPAFSGTVASSRVELKAFTPISHLNLHQVCGNGWNEFTMTWNNWGQQTGGSCGVVDTLNNITTDRPTHFNVSGFIDAAGTYTVGGETFDTRTLRRFGSRNAGVPTNRPVLKLTLQR